MPKRKNQALIDSDSSGSASESGSDLDNVRMYNPLIDTHEIILTTKNVNFLDTGYEINDFRKPNLT